MMRLTGLAHSAAGHCWLTAGTGGAAAPSQQARRASVVVAAAGKVYAVAVGRNPGLFPTWDAARKEVDGFSGAVFKAFKSKQEAYDWLGQDSEEETPAPREQRAPRRVAPPPPARKPTQGAPGPRGGSVRERERQQEQHEDGAAAYELAPPDHRINPSLWYQVEYDGGSRGNPGVMGWGAVLRERDRGHVVAVCAGFRRRGTNNESEYSAALLGIQVAKQLGITKVVLQGDSELVTRQLQGVYRVTAPSLRQLHAKVAQRLGTMAQVKLVHVPRRHNRAADQLSNVAMDVAELSRLQPTQAHEAVAQWQQQGGADAAMRHAHASPTQGAGSPAPLLHRVRRLAQGVALSGGTKRGPGDDDDPCPPLPDHLTTALAMELLRACPWVVGERQLRQQQQQRGGGMADVVASVAWALPAGAPAAAPAPAAMQEPLPAPSEHLPRVTPAPASPPSQDEGEAAATSLASAAPRRRGRPPKARSTSNVSAAVAGLVASSGNVAKRARGRPRKQQLQPELLQAAA